MISKTRGVTSGMHSFSGTLNCCTVHIRKQPLQRGMCTPQGGHVGTYLSTQDSPQFREMASTWAIRTISSLVPILMQQSIEGTYRIRLD